MSNYKALFARHLQVNERTRTALFGGLFAAAGIGAAAGIYWHPERLRVPGWVAYAACVAFVFAGLSGVAQAFSRPTAATWLSVAFMAALVLTALWVALGPGSRECTVSLSSFGWLGSSWLCRGVFGFGALVGVAVLLWVFLRALRRQNVA